MFTTRSIRVFFPLLLLLIPLIAMEFSDQVRWNRFDFLLMGSLLLLVGLGIHLILNKVKRVSYRLLYLTFITIVFLLIWVELAVGIFGLPFSGN